ncbi:MAG TPA: aldo/keto reductase [Streptosporangiaceae bacterium]|jgi:aryl-alcohol dehydrogenase-like predicted oxidoreductase
MEYRDFGRTGVRVSRLALGAMMFGSWGASYDDSAKIARRAFDAGINFVDTADMYSQGESEEFVGRILAEAGNRDEIVLATKFHNQMGEGLNRSGNSRRWIVQEVENSLRRLRTDRIDLYQVHRPDPATDIDETLGALTDLVRAGKILYIGTSTFPAHEIVEAQWTAERRGRERFVGEQPPYSILARGIETDVLPTVRKYGMGVLTWSPLAGGWLTGRYRKGAVPESRRAQVMPERYDMSIEGNRQKLDAADALAQVADEAGLSLVEMALAWNVTHPAVTSAIIGPRTLDHLEGQLTAADLTLGADVLDRIDAIVPPGTTLNDADGGWRPPALADAALRRR